MGLFLRVILGTLEYLAIPPPPVDESLLKLDALSRRDRLGGLFHEYNVAA